MLACTSDVLGATTLLCAMRLYTEYKVRAYRNDLFLVKHPGGLERRGPRISFFRCKGGVRQHTRFGDEERIFRRNRYGWKHEHHVTPLSSNVKPTILSRNSFFILFIFSMENLDCSLDIDYFSIENHEFSVKI